MKPFLWVIGWWWWWGSFVRSFVLSFVGSRGYRVVSRDRVRVVRFINWSWGMISRWVVGGGDGGMDSMNSVVRLVEADTNTGQVTAMADQCMVTLVRLSCSNGKSQQQQSSSGLEQQQQHYQQISSALYNNNGKDDSR